MKNGYKTAKNELYVWILITLSPFLIPEMPDITSKLKMALCQLLMAENHQTLFDVFLHQMDPENLKSFEKKNVSFLFWSFG